MKPKISKILRWAYTWIMYGAFIFSVAVIIAREAWGSIPIAIFCLGGLIILTLLNFELDEL